MCSYLNWGGGIGGGMMGGGGMDQVSKQHLSTEELSGGCEGAMTEAKAKWSTHMQIHTYIYKYCYGNYITTVHNP